jgi:enoyl-CoA hydratase/3-hydroxyacyl-CoA dehydrogenase
VVLIDVSDEILMNALEKIRWSLEGLAARGLVKELPDAILNSIKATTFYDQAKDVDLVIEAAVEDAAENVSKYIRISSN